MFAATESSAAIPEILLWGSIALFSLLLILFLLLAISFLSRVERRRRLSQEIEEEATAVSTPHSFSEKAMVVNLGKTVIRRVDNIDDTISAFSKSRASEKVVRQLRALRADLIDLLKQNSIEAYRFADGMEIDASIRKVVAIVETRRKAGLERPIIAETLCSGFRYVGEEGPEILRKAEVVVLESTE